MAKSWSLEERDKLAGAHEEALGRRSLGARTYLRTSITLCPSVPKKKGTDDKVA